MNALDEGLRAQTLILPGESAQEFAVSHQQLIDDLEPCSATEHSLVHDIARARWVHRRVERAQFERIKAQIDATGAREDAEVDAELTRLWDSGGLHQLYGLSNTGCTAPLCIRPVDVDDPNTPSRVVKRLEATAKGCEALINTWRAIDSRVKEGLEIQSHDRLKAIHMLGLRVIDAVNDKRVAQIFITTFGLHPIGRNNAYEDFKTDMGTLEAEAFAARIRKQWPLLLDASDTPVVRDALLDLVAREIERLESKREVHFQYADERKASSAACQAWDQSQTGQQLARFELATSRRAERCFQAFFKFRREMAAMADMMADGGEAFETENIADLEPETGVAEEASIDPNQNLTNEPEAAVDASEAKALKELAAIDQELNQALEELRKMREAGVGAFAAPGGSGGAVHDAIAAAIFGSGGAMKPSS